MRLIHASALATTLMLTPLAAAMAQVVAPSPAARNIAQEERTRALVVGFHDTVFNKHDLGVAEKLLSPDYKQHNPLVPDGRAPFIGYFTGFFAKNPDSHVRVYRTAVDGDLVYLHSNAMRSATDRGLAIVDIFRVADGKIVEHWDVVQPVPETSANANTMF